MSSEPVGSADVAVAILERYRSDIIAAMRHFVDGDSPSGDPLYGMIRYHLGWEGESGDPLHGSAGKMLRPALLLLCCSAAGGEVERAMPAAAAIELLHNFTLIHDDIEDRSETRHGRPTLWRRYGVPLAVNAGDGLWAIARRTLHALPEAGLSAERTLAVMRFVDDACVALCEGQDRDLRFEGDPDVGIERYLQMIEGKTGVLIAASAACGAVVAGASESDARRLYDFGLRLGRAFQVRDDWLGVWGDPGRTGKVNAEDVRSRKLAYPAVHAFAAATPADRHALTALYRDPIDDDGVAEALAIIERTGARDATEALAGEAAADAVSRLAALPLGAPQRDELTALARYAAARHR